MSHYFAYGSNMDQEQMKERCPDSELVGVAILQDYKIDFTIFASKINCGCADIVRSVGSEVWGILYKYSDDDRLKLDGFEGHPVNYRRFQIAVVDEKEAEIIADSYEVVNKSLQPLKSSKHYLGLMTDASKKFDFPLKYQQILLKVETVD